MSYSQNYFGKEIDDLVYQDIVDYFATPRTESTTIEYKSYGPQGNHGNKLKGIYKCICALLNSSGGILIWGSPQGTIPSGQTEEVFQGALSPITQLIEQDRTINQITDSISPAPSGFKLKILENSGNYLCVFEVEQSMIRPHQTDNIYYVRLDGQSRPAPHYLIEALFKQISFPNIEGYLKISHFFPKPGGRGYNLVVDFCIFNFSALENEFDLNLRVLIDKGIFNHSGSGELRLPNIKDILYFGEPLSEPQKIGILNNQLNNDFILNLVMYFGGKKGPLKMSEYTLDLSRNANNLNNLIVSKTENITFKEKQDLIGSDKSTILRKVLGR